MNSTEQPRDIYTMPARELLRGLMRGNRAELKLGYSPMNAALAIKRIHPSEDLDSLRGYAEGFSDGMHPELPPMWSKSDADTPEHRAYNAGYAAGQDEDPDLTYPSEAAV